MNTTMLNPFGVTKLGQMTLVPYEENPLKANKTILFNPENKVEAKEQLEMFTELQDLVSNVNKNIQDQFGSGKDDIQIIKKGVKEDFIQHKDGKIDLMNLTEINKMVQDVNLKVDDIQNKGSPLRKKNPKPK